MAEHPPHLQPERLLRLPEVKTLCGVGASTIYRWIALGEFPKQRKLSRRSVVWSSSEIMEWIASREVA